jgi:hypothetical protein
MTQTIDGVCLRLRADDRLLVRSTRGCRSLYTVADLAGDRSISRMSPWCTIAT